MVIFESTLAGGAGATFGDFEEVGEGEAAAVVEDPKPVLDDIGAELERTGSVFKGLELAVEGIGTAFDGIGMGFDTGAVFEEADIYPEGLEPEF